MFFDIFGRGGGPLRVTLGCRQDFCIFIKEYYQNMVYRSLITSSEGPWARAWAHGTGTLGPWARAHGTGTLGPGPGLSDNNNRFALSDNDKSWIPNLIPQDSSKNPSLQA